MLLCQGCIPSTERSAVGDFLSAALEWSWEVPDPSAFKERLSAQQYISTAIARPYVSV